MAKKNLMKIASIGLPIAGAIIGFLSDRVSEEQRRAEMREEISAEMERKFTERFGTEEIQEDEELI